MAVSKILSQQILLIAVLLGGALSVDAISHIVLSDNVQGDTTQPVTYVTYEEGFVHPGLTSRLKIPKIGVDARFESVGLTSDGAMDVPKDPMNVAWFNFGQRPGEEGSAVVAGHYGWKDGKEAVFDDLHTLQVGDSIYIEDEQGVETTFIVRELRIYGWNENPADVFSSSDGKSHLNLVTCQGTWNKAEKSYSNRLVVFADKE